MAKLSILFDIVDNNIMKGKLLTMCTCTWVEIWTAIGVTGYLIHLQNYALASIAASLFAPLIGFHFLMDRISKKEERVVRKLSRLGNREAGFQ